jgi:hypothetical protein
LSEPEVELESSDKVKAQYGVVLPPPFFNKKSNLGGMEYSKP